MNMKNIDLAALEKDLQELAAAETPPRLAEAELALVPPHLDPGARRARRRRGLLVALRPRVSPGRVSGPPCRPSRTTSGLQEKLGQPIGVVWWPSQSAAPNARIEETEKDVMLVYRGAQRPRQGAREGPAEGRPMANDRISESSCRTARRSRSTKRTAARAKPRRSKRPSRPARRPRARPRRTSICPCPPPRERLPGRSEALAVHRQAVLAVAQPAVDLGRRSCS